MKLSGRKKKTLSMWNCIKEELREKLGIKIATGPLETEALPFLWVRTIKISSC